MAKQKINIRVSEDEKLDAYLELMNGVLKLTPTQLKVLTELIRENPKACTPKSRVEVTSKMGFKSVTVTNNFIKVLRDKGIILKDRDAGLFHFAGTVVPPKGLESVEFIFK